MAQEVVRALGNQIGGPESTAIAREAFAALAIAPGGMTQRDVARLLGVSHPTVGRLARRWKMRETEGDDDRGT
jgi:transposase